MADSKPAGSNPASSNQDTAGNANHRLDAKGMNCPLPILKARKALNAMAAGETLFVEATDAGSVADFAAFCRTTGNELLDSGQNAGVYNYLIRKHA